MKQQLSQKKPLQSRHRGNSGQEGPSGQAQTPRMLRRMTSVRSFMDVDLEYLLQCDPSTSDPFENASSLLSDPPSLFRPLPPVAAAAQAIAQGAAPWMFQRELALQHEQEALRFKYLQFLHQLQTTNAHSFLNHVTAFAGEHPQEFLQLQSYIQYQDQLVHQQREEQLKQAELVRYQLELEKRNKREQDLRRFQQFQENQERQQEQQKQQELLLEWLLRRQQHRSSQRKEPDRADLFTLAFQRDPQLVGKMVSSPGGMDLLLTPQQQVEFNQFLQWNRLEEERRQKQDILGNMSYLSAATSTSIANPLPILPQLNLNFSSGGGRNGLLGNMPRNNDKPRFLK